MSDTVTKTAFHEVQAALGGTFVENAGWLWCEGFGDVQHEYDAARNDVAVWDVSPLTKWELRGPDALPAARRMHSNDVLSSDIGQVRYGPLLDGEGMVVDDGTVFKLAEDRCWLMINGSVRQTYFDEATHGLDVSVEWITPQLPHLGVVGPRSRDVMSELCDIDLGGLSYYRFVPDEVHVGGVPATLSRTGFGGEMGYEIFTSPEHAEALWHAIVGKGVRPFGVDAIEILRIEAGMIVAGYDYEPHGRTPYDLGLDRFVMLDAPGELFGRDRLREVAAAPPNRFKTLVIDGDGELPGYGADIRQGDVVGTLTSPTASPRFGNMGIGIVRTDSAEDGTRLEVEATDGWIPATVANLPVYDPDKKRPRGAAD